MQIRSFGCAQYKAFRDPVSVELRPLTLFFGKNNSGKSALLRLVRLLLRAASDRLRGEEFPLDVDGLSYGTEFLDLVHGRLPSSHVAFNLALDHNGKQFDLKTEVQHILGVSFDRSVLSRAQLNVDDKHWEWQFIPDRERGSVSAALEWVPARGLWPHAWMSESSPEELRHQIDYWRSGIARFEDGLTHLGPVRAPIALAYKPKQPTPLAFDGEGFINWLARDTELLRRVGDWFATHLDGWRFALDFSGFMVECILRKGGITINMTNAGQGMQQLLPIVVLQLAHQTGLAGPFFDLVEEPESSLHAAAHAALGDLFLETAKLGQGQVLVETHSENLLLRIRRRIAEGKADPELVALYWVEDCAEGFSRVQRIHIARNGEVDWWPTGIFSEDYQEVRALRRANLERNQKERVVDRSENQ
ncbi:MAG: AAA family ATPase [Magnetococcales bacterium]|nr:AAA family ATPase [Magnetococcales bacterium]